MIPVLFKGNETNFNHNGIGLLKDTLSCEVTEVRNGSFDLELVYPVTGPYFKDLKNGNIIQAKPNDTDPPHNFRINEIDKTLSDKEVVVYAVSITNDLGGNMVKSLYLADVTPQVILNEMKKVLHYPTPFNFVSNITTIGSVDWTLNNPLNLIVGEEGSLVDIFGGEVKRTNDTIFLYGRRGKDNVTTIRAGKNLDGFKMTESFQGKYTQILPYFKYEEEVQGEVPVEGESYAETERQEVTIFGSIVSSPYHGRYPVNAIKPIDFSQNERVREAKTLEALNAEASRYFKDLYSEIDKPSVSINVDMIQLVDSEQYELYERLEKKELTDTVSVYVPEHDVDVLVKITELKYDSLRERTISIVAGSSGRTSLMDEISGSYKQFTTNLVNDKIQSATAGIVNQVLTTKTGVNMYAGRATPPDGAKPGDIWFKDVGGGDIELYEFDGVNWVRKMYKGFGDDVRRLVEEKIAEAENTFTEAISEHDRTISEAMTRAGQANDLAQQAKTDAANASLSATRANQEAQQARTSAANAKADALTAIAKADNTRNELLGRVSTLDSKARDLTTKSSELQTQANDISNRLTTLGTETGTKFQNQSRLITDLQGNVTGIEERISKQRVGSRNLLLGTRDNSGNGWYDTGEEYLGVKVNRRQGAWYGLTSPVKVYAGHEYIFSYYYKLSSDAAGRLITYLSKVGNHPDKPLAGYSYISGYILDITDNKDKWLLHTTKIKVTSDGWLWPRVEKSTGTGFLYIGPRQFEEGNVPTQWHPNEEDVSEEEMIYRRGIEGTLSQYSSTIQNIDGTVTTHTSQLTQHATQIASKVAQTEFNNEKTKIGNMQTTINQQANQIALKAEKTYVDTVKRTVDSHTTTIEQQANQIALKADNTKINELTGRMEATESIISIQADSIRNKVSKTEFDAEKRKIGDMQTSISQQASQISLKANTTDLNNVTNRLTTAEGTIRTQAGQIELKAAKTELTPIQNALSTKVDINQVNSAITAGTNGIRQEVTAVKGVLQGGISARNYAVGTATPSVHSVDSRTSTVSSGFVVKTLYTTHENKTLRELGFVVGDKYTVVFDIYAVNKTAFRDYRVEGYKSAGYSHLVGSVINTIGTTTHPTQFVGTFTLSSDDYLNTNKWVIRLDLSHMNITVKNFRIFKGEIKQDWYPAWEDQEAALDAAKARIDITEQAITSLLTGSKTLPDGRTSTFATKIESLEGAINQRVTTQQLNDKGYQTASQVNTAITAKGYQTANDVTNTINGRTDLARKTDIPTYIGGRNLWIQSKATGSFVTETLPDNHITGQRKCYKLYNNMDITFIIEPNFSSRLYRKVTFSAWIKYENVVKGTNDWNKFNCFKHSLVRKNSSTGAVTSTEHLTLAGFTGTSDWKYVTYTYDYSSNTSYDQLKTYIKFNLEGVASGSAWVTGIMIQLGTIPTGHEKAPEDAEVDLTDRLAGYVTNQTYTTYTTDRQQTDRQITEQINQTVSKVPTGPVNLIVNGFDPQTLDPWKNWNTTNWTLELTTHPFFYAGRKKLMRFKTSTSTTKGTFESGVFNIKRNTKYTIRVGIFANTNCKELRFCFGRGTSTTSISDYAMAHQWFTGNASRLEYKTLTVDSGNFDYGKLTFDHNGTKTSGQWADMYIAEISIIEGEFNNSWTPSFDELITEQKFNETKSTVDSFSRAIGTRVEGNIIPNIARLVMTQDAVISEVAKYGEHTSNLVQDSVRFSTTKEINGSGPTVISDGNISWRKSGATTNTWAGIDIPLNVKRFISGEKYTLAFDYYLYASPDADIGVEIKDYTNNRSYCYGFIANASTPTKVYRHFQQTFTIAHGTYGNTRLEGLFFRLTKNGYIGIRNVMLVRGEKIGPYSTSQVDTVATRVEQTANSYAIKFINNANDITTQLNLADDRVRIKSKLIQLDAGVTVSGEAWLNGAVIKSLSADKITTGTLNANNVRITNLSVKDVAGIDAEFIKTTIGTAFIEWMKGKRITAMNGNMTIDLNDAKITFNADAKIQFNSQDNALFRNRNGVSAFIHFRDDSYNGVYTAMGVNADGTSTQNDYSSGSFAGVRVVRSRNTNPIIDQVQLVGDVINIRHGWGSEHDYVRIKWDGGARIDLVQWVRAVANRLGISVTF